MCYLQSNFLTIQFGTLILNKLTEIKMAEIIIIRGQQNSGKTTTTGLVYKELLKHAVKEHIFNNKSVNEDSLSYNNLGATIDFTAILTIKSKSVGIVSYGDIAEETEKRLEYLISAKVNIIICTARSVNKQGSTYRKLVEHYSKTNNIAFELSTEYSENKDLKNEVKMKIVDKIINKTIELIDK